MSRGALCASVRGVHAPALSMPAGKCCGLEPQANPQPSPVLAIVCLCSLLEWGPYPGVMPTLPSCLFAVGHFRHVPVRNAKQCKVPGLGSGRGAGCGSRCREWIRIVSAEAALNQDISKWQGCGCLLILPPSTLYSNPNCLQQPVITAPLT